MRKLIFVFIAVMVSVQVLSLSAFAKDKAKPKKPLFSEKVSANIVKVATKRALDQYGDIATVESAVIATESRFPIDDNWEGGQASVLVTLKFIKSSRDIGAELEGNENGRHGDVQRFLDEKSVFGSWKIGETYKLRKVIDFKRKYSAGDNWNAADDDAPSWRSYNNDNSVDSEIK